MELAKQLSCLFSAEVEQRDGSYVVEVPEQELRLGDLDSGKAYRVALLSTSEETTTTTTTTTQESRREQTPLEPPVEEGDTREVEIEDIGEQGDGITRVERGYVVIVPDTDEGERVTIEITDVRENVAFAEVVDRQTQVS